MGKRYRDGDKLHAKEFNALLNNVDENTANIQTVKNSIPRRTSQLINDSGFITQDVNNWRPVKIDGNEVLNNKPEKPLALNSGTNITLSSNNGVITIDGKVYTGGNNINVSNDVITAKGYVYSDEKKSIAEGSQTVADGYYSHAEGIETSATTAYSHAEGMETEAGGYSSHAEGAYTSTSNSYAHAEGNGTIASNEAEHAEGSYNVSHQGTIHSIGIGTAASARTNAVEVMSNGDVYINGIGNYDGRSISTATRLQDVVISGGGVKLVRLTQEQYDALISAGTIDEMTLYIIVAPSTVTATFTNYDGTVLYTQTVPYGEIPSYSGSTPTRSDDYDPIENLGTEYAFNGWSPSIEPITANTTFVAQYSERQFRYVTTEKYVRETRNGLDVDKNYLLVGPGLSVSGELHLAINHVYNNSKVFETMTTTIYTEQTFDNLEEFTISGATPTVFLGIYPDGDALYFKDRTDDKYIASSTASTGSNAFNTKASISGTDPSLELDSKFRWILDENMNLYNVTYGRVVRYNPDSPRFAPYKSGQNTAVLFYQVTEQTKEYINNNRLLKSNKPVLTIPIAYFEKYIEALPEEEQR